MTPPLPHCKLTERYAVSSILENPGLLGDVQLQGLEPDHFLDGEARDIFAEVRNLESKGEAISAAAVTARLKQRRALQRDAAPDSWLVGDVDAAVSAIAESAIRTPPARIAVYRLVAKVQRDAEERRAILSRIEDEERAQHERDAAARDELDAAAMDDVADAPPSIPRDWTPPADDMPRAASKPHVSDLLEAELLDFEAERARTAAPPPPDDAPHAADREPPSPDPSRYRMTEIGNGERFAAMHGARFRFVHGRGWSMWDGKRWANVERGDQMTAAKAVVAELYAEAAALSARASRACNADGSISDAANRAGGLASALIDHARKSSKATALEAMLKLAQSESPIAAARCEFDSDPWALNVGNGTLDLRTGHLRPHRQTDMITKLAPIVYDPAAPAKRWEAFLARVLPDPELLAWVQRFAGYCLTGNVSEQALAFAYGTGQNGKNVLLDSIAGVMGDYAIRAAPDLLLSRHGEAHPTQEADLDGVRLALCSEIDEGRAWAEALIKRITGDRRLRARKMGKDFYEFDATHKLIIAANSKPKMRGTDHGIWRRMNLVPFTVTIPERERIKDFDQLLLAEEAPGILAWLVRGCLAWQCEGLGTASAISKATATYREEQDVLGQWIAEECVLVAGVFTPTTKLYKMFHSWCERAGRHPWTRDAMREGLIGREGITERRSNIARGFDGIGAAELARDDEDGDRQAAEQGRRGAERTYYRGGDA